MAYAGEQQIIERYGADTLLLAADRDGDGEIDSEVVRRALEDASAEIDTYLAAKYDLPLPKVPEVLARLSVDIALYRLSSTTAEGTDERRRRYEDAVKLLKRIASGEVSLGLSEPPPSAGGVKFSGRRRRFSRPSMAGTR